MRRGAVILCGGRSRRMGRDKALLPFGGETLLGRTARIVSRCVPAEKIVCVAAAQQQLPRLPHGLSVVRDASPDQGPLAALALGLRSLQHDCDAVLAVGCDTPLMAPALADWIFDQMSGANAAMFVIDGHRQPLPAVYAIHTTSTAEALIAAGRRSLNALLDECGGRELAEREAKRVDPQLLSFINCNDHVSYARALAEFRSL